MKPKVGYIYNFTMYEYIIDINKDNVVYFIPEDEYPDDDEIEFYIKRPENFSTDIFCI